MERKMTTTSRMAWVDNLRGLACILVLVIHSSMPIELNRFISPFFLTIFFMLSGYLFKDRPLLSQLKNIVNRLLIPYIFAAVTRFLVVRCVKEGIVFDIHLLHGILGTVLFGQSLWFIPCLIVIEVMFTFLRQAKVNKFLVMFASLFSILLINSKLVGRGEWCVLQAVFCLSYFALGNILRDKEDLLNKISRRMVLAGCLVYLLLYVVWAFVGGIGQSTMHNNHYENPAQFIILSYSSIILIFMLFRHFFNHSNRLMNLFGQNSLWIFAIQSIIIRIIDGGYLRNVESAWKCIPIFLLLTIPGIILSELIRRYLPYISGKYNYLK